MLALKVIGRPFHVHTVNSIEAYERKQRLSIIRKKRVYPNLEWRDPIHVELKPPPFIGGGYWKIMCPCMNAPSADPDWRVACCFECGAIYTQLEFPENELRQRAERVLLFRGYEHQRNWNPRIETLNALVIENLQNGDAIPNESWALDILISFKESHGV